MWALILQRLIHIFISVLKLLGMNYNILTNLARIIVNLISRKFKKHS